MLWGLFFLDPFAEIGSNEPVYSDVNVMAFRWSTRNDKIYFKQCWRLKGKKVKKGDEIATIS